MRILFNLKAFGVGLFFSRAVFLPGAPLIFTLSSSPGTELAMAIPVSVTVDLKGVLQTPDQGDRLQLVTLDQSRLHPPIPVQFEPDTSGSLRGTLRWLVPPGKMDRRKWVLEPRRVPFEKQLRIQMDPATGQWDISEAGQKVLRYNYQTNEPGERLAQVHPDNRKYARARSDYLHPLYGFGGVELTKDWSIDHPHHRGIYWAWPEVDYRGERGDLHALQRVYARPTGRCLVQEGPVLAQVQADNEWLWEDRDPIVREQALIRVWRANSTNRFLDLEFKFTALKDDVAIARREAKLYGGLNIRLAPVKDQQIVFHTDPVAAVPRRAWAELSGIFAGGKTLEGLTVFQHPGNPDYPGDWVQYPEINWFQPTFPASGTRFVLKKDQPLVLRYRLWLHAGKTDEASLAALWTAYAHPPTVTLNPQTK